MSIYTYFADVNLIIILKLDVYGNSPIDIECKILYIFNAEFARCQ